MKFYKGLFLFIVINFGALAIGTWLMNDGPQSEWYSTLNQAPWSPPGWVVSNSHSKLTSALRMTGEPWRPTV